jgi:hypothetical protein
LRRDPLQGTAQATDRCFNYRYEMHKV